MNLNEQDMTKLLEALANHDAEALSLHDRIAPIAEDTDDTSEFRLVRMPADWLWNFES